MAYFAENGRLSYENPNYQLHLDAVRLEDALNSNTEHFNLNSTLLGYNMDVLSPQLANMVSALWPDPFKSDRNGT